MARNTTIKPEELTAETFPIYCRMCLTEEMYKVLPSTSPLNYGHINNILSIVENSLFKHIDTETGKLLLVNRIYSLVKSVTEEEFSREFLYELVEELSNYMPDMEDPDFKKIKELMEIGRSI